MPILSAKGVTHLYNKGTPSQSKAIYNINVDIEEGELVGIIGHTGSGKSTLVQHFNGLLKPENGQIIVDGKDIWKDKKSTREARFKVGLCFQYPEYQLFEETVYKDISFGPKNMGLKEEEIHKRVLLAAEYVGLKKELLEKSPFDLSGGEKRRAAIAGVIAMQPKVLILDEPTAGLDPKGRDRILEMIKSYRERTGSTVLLVSHSMEDVAKIATKVLVMNKGQVEMYGTVDEVYSHSEELRNIGLNVPQVSKVFEILKNNGMNLGSAYTVEKAAEIILSKGGASV
ncbi:MAG: energy-coupling factor transporter ATPase [Acutalibacteraceae bacterium]|nr:energy-coupling factor transporter ATPase [Acutalibacteraceae bacterium]